MEVYNITKGKTLATSAQVVNTFFGRLVGLLNRSDLPMGEGLIIKPCNAVHSCFMRFPIDVLFLDVNYQIVSILENMEPFRFSSREKAAKIVVELPTGVISLTGTQIGDRLSLTVKIH